MNIDWQIPPSVSHWLEVMPDDKSVALLLRHSVRDDLPLGDAAYTLPITEKGTMLAKKLGNIIGQRLKSLHTSPLTRCVQTADALRTGSEIQIPINKDNHLGDPGVYVLNDKKAAKNWETLGHEGVMHHLVNSTHALPGMARPDQAAHFLVQHMLSATDGVPGLHIFVTHDSLVTATSARLLGKTLGPNAWPWYLEGSFFWYSENQIHTAYRDGYCIKNTDTLFIHKKEKLEE